MKIYVICYTKAPSYRKLKYMEVAAYDRYDAMKVWRKRVGKDNKLEVLSITKSE